MKNVTQLNANPWRSADALASALGVSTRTIYRRAKKGAVESVQTPDGMRYRICQPTDTERVSVSVTPPATDTLVSQLVTALERVADLERIAGRADVLAVLVEQQADMIADLQGDVDRLHRIAEERLIDSVTWRARAHVAEGRLEMNEA